MGYWPNPADYLVSLIVLFLIFVIIWFIFPYTIKSKDQQITFWDNLRFAVITSLLFLVVIAAFLAFTTCLFGMIWWYSRRQLCGNMALYFILLLVSGTFFALMSYILFGYVHHYLNNLQNS
jgi:hypothetical protein